jgi:hypothetical protein
MIRSDGTNQPTRYVLATLAFAALHYALSYGSLFVAGGIVMAAFEGEGSVFLARIAAAIMYILHFPVVQGVADVIPGLRGLGTVLFISNSLVWGLAATLVWSWSYARRQCRRSA